MQLELHTKKRIRKKKKQIYINPRNNRNPFRHIPGAAGAKRGDLLTGSFIWGAVGNFDGVCTWTSRGGGAALKGGNTTGVLGAKDGTPSSMLDGGEAVLCVDDFIELLLSVVLGAESDIRCGNAGGECKSGPGLSSHKHQKKLSRNNNSWFWKMEVPFGSGGKMENLAGDEYALCPKTRRRKNSFKKMEFILHKFKGSLKLDTHLSFIF